MSENPTSLKTQKISFFSKNIICCPVCHHEFHKEELLTGRGRTIAGQLGIDLRRFWEANPKYGKVIPTIYSVVVCPSCYYATYPNDFLSLMRDPIACKNLYKLKDERFSLIKELLEEDLNFYTERGLKEGIASYILAILCYEQLPSKINPTFKCAMSALRLAWLADEANKQYPQENWDYLARIFYTKASFLYELVVDQELNGQEDIEQIRYFGPDSDVNYGYTGVLYLAVLLQYLFGSKENKQARLNALNKGRATLSRIVGLGKSSKEKPSDIIDKAREVYQRVARECRELEIQLKNA